MTPAVVCTSNEKSAVIINMKRILDVAMQGISAAIYSAQQLLRALINY